MTAGEAGLNAPFHSGSPGLYRGAVAWLNVGGTLRHRN